MMHRRLLLLLVLLASLAGLTTGPLLSAANAKTGVRFGIGDQHPAMFADERWQDLDLRITRYNVPWDATKPGEEAILQRAVNFVTAADEAGVETLVHVTGRTREGVTEALPSRAAYRKRVRELVAVLRPLGIEQWGAWNEANHSTQPTGHHPERAAQFFLELRGACRGCTIVALDVLTQGSSRSTGVSSYRGYAKRFYTALGSKRSLAKIIGFHNYGDVNRGSGPVAARDFSRFVRRYNKAARFWITESGGTAALRTRACDLDIQTLGTRRMFSHAESLRSGGYGVDRLYMYNWTADTCGELFDSGLIRQDGTARPAFYEILKGAPRFAR